MKVFNYSIILFSVVVLSGFILFKDWFIRPEARASLTEKSSQILYNRVNYLDYTKQNLASSQKFGRTILFFAATKWCSNCAALDAEIKKRNSQLPANITILKVDYDNDKQTKASYGVTMQTTLVLLDENGHESKRWIGSNFDNLMENIN